MGIHLGQAFGLAQRGMKRTRPSFSLASARRQKCRASAWSLGLGGVYGGYPPPTVRPAQHHTAQLDPCWEWVLLWCVGTFSLGYGFRRARRREISYRYLSFGLQAGIRRSARSAGAWESEVVGRGRWSCCPGLVGDGPPDGLPRPHSFPSGCPFQDA